MATLERLPLVPVAPGTRRSLTVRRYGRPGARPKVYLQAALHANELPGILVLHHLTQLLEAADARGQVTGEVVLVPTANPIGLAQNVNGRHLGRMELGGGGNFNRGHPQFADKAAARIGNRLTDDAQRNVAIVREALLAAAAALPERTEFEHLRKRLAMHAVDADVVLDLHSHGEAVLYLYMGKAYWPAWADLPAQLGCRRVLLWETDDGHSFDEAMSAPWLALAKRFPDRPIPPSCLGVTVELRGHNQISDAVNRADAENLFRFLQRRKVVAGDPGPLPQAVGDPAPVDGIDHARAPMAGLVLYRKELGDMVKAGETVAEVVDPLADDPAKARAPVVARTDGMFFGRDIDRLVRPGDPFITISGLQPMPEPEPAVD